MHVIGGESVFSIIPIGIWVWAGIYFRTPHLPALLPLRRERILDRGVDEPGDPEAGFIRAPRIPSMNLH